MIESLEKKMQLMARSYSASDHFTNDFIAGFRACYDELAKMSCDMAGEFRRFLLRHKTEGRLLDDDDLEIAFMASIPIVRAEEKKLARLEREEIYAEHAEDIVAERSKYTRLRLAAGKMAASVKIIHNETASICLCSYCEYRATLAELEKE